MRKLTIINLSIMYLLFNAVEPAWANDGRVDFIRVEDFGAKGDGKTDDTKAIQNALNEAERLGRMVVKLGSGSYCILGNLRVPQAVTLEGQWRIPPTPWKGSGKFRDLNLPSVLLAYSGKGEPDSKPFIILEKAASLIGLCVYYPEQVDTEKPYSYPWTIRSSENGDGCGIVNVLLVNPYRGVDFGTNPTARHYIKGLYGQPLKTGLFIDACFDVGRIEDVHFWPFWGYGWSAVSKFIKKEGEGIVVGRSDWQLINNCFIIGMKTGFKFIKSQFKSLGTSLGPGNMLVTGGGADICENAVIIDDVQSHAGVSFTNCQLYGDIIVGPNNYGPIKFTACGFFGSVNGERGVTQGVLEGHGRVSFDNCSFVSFDKSLYKKANATFKLGINNASFQNCEFMDERQVRFELFKPMQLLTLIGNSFRNDMKLQYTSAIRIINIGNAINIGESKIRKVDLASLRFISTSNWLVENGDFIKMSPDGIPLGWEAIGNPAQLSVTKSKVKKTIHALVAYPGVLPVSLASGLQKNITLKPSTEYVLSAYLWNNSSDSSSADVNVDLDGKANLRLALTASDNSKRGYYVWGQFNSDETGKLVKLRIFYDNKSGSFPLKEPVGKWANISITPLSEFKDPVSK